MRALTKPEEVVLRELKTILMVYQVKLCQQEHYSATDEFVGETFTFVGDKIHLDMTLVQGYLAS